jgi:microcystin-dependent protein
MYREQYADTVFDPVGEPLNGATLTVRDVDEAGVQGGLTAEIFQTETGSAKANPFTTGADGYWEFWLTIGRRYDIIFTASELSRTWRVSPGYWLGNFPIGATMPWGGDTTPPTGWLLADGSAVSRATYAKLFGVIGTKFGKGDGSTTFNLPPMTDKFPIGKSGTKIVGSTGGEATHLLTTSEMPTHSHPHAHTFNVSNAPGGVAALAYRGTGLEWLSAGTSSDSTTAGGGQAHNNIPPYVALAYIIKT